MQFESSAKESPVCGTGHWPMQDTGPDEPRFSSKVTRILNFSPYLSADVPNLFWLNTGKK